MAQPGVAIPQIEARGHQGLSQTYMVNRRCVLFIHYVWNVMCCLHTTVPGCYFALTNCLSTINRSLYLSGTIDHCGTRGETLRALLHVLFMLYLVLSYSIVYAACSNIYNFNNTARSISLHLQTAFLTSRSCVRVALIKPVIICKALNYNF